MIALREIQKRFGSKLILDIPSFDIAEGIYWIRGFNGSGKTTLLKILSGVIPYLGDTLINGISQKKKPVYYRKFISYAEAEPLYPGFLSGQEILDFYASIKKEKKEILLELTEKLKLHYYIKTPTGTYSSGMLKKLSLLLAFTGKPKIILLDEPHESLDAESSTLLCEMIKQFRDRYGTSFLLTSNQDLSGVKYLITNKLLVENQTIQEII
jgi:ABC-2 type transport system ATP-binding protein